MTNYRFGLKLELFSYNVKLINFFYNFAGRFGLPNFFPVDKLNN
jgi:hypothetical protein